MALSNRKTRQTYTSQHGQFAPVDTFNKTFSEAPTDKTQILAQDIVRDLAKRLPPGLAPEKRREFIQGFKDQVSSPAFKKAMEDPEVVDSLAKLRDASQKLHEQATKDSTSMMAFAKTLGKSLVSPLIGSYFPIAGLLLSALPAAMAATNWQIHEGMPTGGKDLCSSVLVYGCLQGYLTNGTEPWTLGDPQFSRIISEIDGKDSLADSTYITLRDCLTTDVVGGVSVNVFNANPGEVTGIDCAATSSDWHNYHVKGVATGLPADSCVDYQNTFNVAVSNCQNALARAGLTAAIVGGTLGGICVCACIIGGIYYACNRDNGCRVSCPCV